MAVAAYYGWGKHSDWTLHVIYATYPFASCACTAIITYVSEHGTTPDPLSVTCSSGDLMFYFTEEMLPVLTASGYSFDGWYQGNVKINVGDLNTSGDLTLTAKWTEVPLAVTARIKTDDGYALVYPETSASQVKTDSGTDLQTVLSNIQSAISALGGSVDI